MRGRRDAPELGPPTPIRGPFHRHAALLRVIHRRLLPFAGLVAAGTRVDAGSFARTHALRALLRELARRNAHGDEPDTDLRGAFADVTSKARLRVALDERGDPRLEPEKVAKGDYTASVAIIDATRPYHWKEHFPEKVGISAELRRKMEEKWKDLLSNEK